MDQQRPPIRKDRRAFLVPVAGNLIFFVAASHMAAYIAGVTEREAETMTTATETIAIEFATFTAEDVRYAERVIVGPTCRGRKLLEWRISRCDCPPNVVSDDHYDAALAEIEANGGTGTLPNDGPTFSQWNAAMVAEFGPDWRETRRYWWVGDDAILLTFEEVAAMATAHRRNEALRALLAA
jgi:hypothetical protein